MTIKLEVGKKYRNRMGEVVKIIEQLNDLWATEFVSSADHSFMSNGRYFPYGEHALDLIEEVIGPAQESVKKPHKWAKEAHAWIDGVEVEWKHPDTGTWFSPKLINYNPIQNYYLEWRIKPPEVPQWRKDLAEKMKAEIESMKSGGEPVAEFKFPDAEDYVGDYEMDCDEGIYHPSEAERFLIADALMGYISDLPKLYTHPAKEQDESNWKEMYWWMHELNHKHWSELDALKTHPAKSLTDEERFLKLFNDFGIELSKSTDGDATIFKMSAHTPNVDGYCDFMAEFIFDNDGNFKKAGVWE